MDGFELRLAQQGSERVGPTLELWINGGGCLVSIFTDRDTNIRFLQAHTLEPIPVEAVEWLLKRAQVELQG